LYGSGVGMIPVAAKALKGVGRNRNHTNSRTIQLRFKLSLILTIQTEMSNTAHTREVADLRNAGLNPILSSKGAGAPTGAGAMAQTPDYANLCPTLLMLMRLLI
jgi:hypothetical protein